MRNRPYTSNTLLRSAVALLSERLPRGWSVGAKPEPRDGRQGERPDAILNVSSPDGRRAAILIEAKAGVVAADAVSIASRLERSARGNNAAGAILVTNYLTPLARERLASAGVSYLDMTGNARIVIDRPGLFIESRGADQDPMPQAREVRSLKGASAARIVRGLCDWTPPVGVRELARRVEVNPGYVTRVLTLLEKENVIVRDSGGAVAVVNWKDLLRRWTQDYAVSRSNRAVAYLEPRDIDALARRLTGYQGAWALTGSRAIPRVASTAPARTLSCYVESPEAAASDLGLRSVERGANVLLLEPFDPVVWERTREEAGLTCVAVSQCAADLMTGTGREPSEAEGLVAWMERNERAWRA
jgi:hypothetical protein